MAVLTANLELSGTEILCYHWMSKKPTGCQACFGYLLGPGGESWTGMKPAQDLNRSENHVKTQISDSAPACVRKHSWRSCRSKSSCAAKTGTGTERDRALPSAGRT